MGEDVLVSGDKVADIVAGQNDFTGTKIETVFSKVGERFAVYATSERVMVQYADDEKLGQDQRLALVGLSPLRGEINGLIDGWRAAKYGSGRSRARWYDRRTADALAVALQGNQPEAEKLLTAIKADVLEERTSIGRYQHIAFATLTAIVICIILWIFTPASVSPETSSFRAFLHQADTWLAAGLGSLGALFSIALAIRGRQMHTDLRRRDNVMDAVLRVVIGAISAFVLFSLFKSKLISLSLSGNEIDLDAASPNAVHAAIIIAFLAGFSERLVGDFLSNTMLDGAGGKRAAPSVRQTTPAVVRNAQHADETDPLGKSLDGGAAAAGVAGDDEDHDHAIDGCLCEVRIADDEQTDDADLPAASGGIEKAAA